MTGTEEKNKENTPSSGAFGAPEGAETEAPEAAAEVEEPEVDPVVEERDKLRAQLMRTAADFDNFRKRSRRDIEEAKKRSKEDTVREILPIIDNLQRAVSASSKATDVEAVLQGINMVLRGFDDVALKLNLERVPAVGATFDPNLHDAVQQIETDEHKPGTIVNEIVPGYRLGERLIRPAMVVVAKPPKPAEPAEPADSEN